MTGERTISYLRLDEIQPAAQNPKRHHAAAIDESISRFGFVDAGVLDERTGKLVAGHGRVEDLIARRDRGDDVPDGVLVADDGMWLAPVQRGWASTTDVEAHAVGIALNRLTELGGWDERELSTLLTEIAEATTLDGLGYVATDLDALMAKLAGPEPPLAFGDAELLAERTEHRCPKCGYEWSGSPVPG